MTSFVDYMKMSNTERQRLGQETPATTAKQDDLDGAWKLLESFPLAYRDGFPRLQKAPCHSVALNTAMLVSVVTAYLQRQPAYTDYYSSEVQALGWRVDNGTENVRQFDIQYDRDNGKLTARIDHCSLEQQEFLSQACECLGMDYIVK
jgi:hypothetical protein